MAYQRSTSEPPPYFQLPAASSNVNVPNNNTRVGSSGFSFFVPVESQAIPPSSKAVEDLDTGPGAIDSHRDYRSSTNHKKHQAINSTPMMSHNTVSSSGDWMPPPPTQQAPAPLSRARNPSTMPPNKQHPSVLFGGKRPKIGSSIPPPDEIPKVIQEPSFYNGYLRGRSESIPAYSSAGNNTGHRKTDYLTKNANPVPGGYRGASEIPQPPRSPKTSYNQNNQPPSPSGKQSTSNNMGDMASQSVNQAQMPTFEEYQTESKKNQQKFPSKKRSFNLEELPVNQFPCLVVLSVSIETMNRLLGRTPKTDVLFEFYGILDSPVNYLPSLKAKKFTLRQGRSYINCIYFETDKVLSKVVRNHFMRCVGKWNLKLKAVVAYSARHAKQEEARKSAVRIEQHEEELAKYFS